MFHVLKKEKKDILVLIQRNYELKKLFRHNKLYVAEKADGHEFEKLIN